MSYFVTVSFDLQNASREDYERVYRAFSVLGLQKEMTSSDGIKVQLPTTTCAGEFTDTAAASVRDYFAAKTKEAIEQNGLNGEVFVAVGGDWAWAHRYPRAVAFNMRR